MHHVNVFAKQTDTRVTALTQYAAHFSGGVAMIDHKIFRKLPADTAPSGPHPLQFI